jgi:anti-sigma B factor antagonist
MPDIPGSLKLSVSDESGRVVVVAEGELDLYTSPRLREILTERIDAGTRHLVIDLARVTFVDSTALGVMVSALKRVKAEGGALELRSPTPSARKVLEITGLNRVFTVTE